MNGSGNERNEELKEDRQKWRLEKDIRQSVC